MYEHPLGLPVSVAGGGEGLRPHPSSAVLLGAVAILEGERSQSSMNETHSRTPSLHEPQPWPLHAGSDVLREFNALASPSC